MFGVGGGGLGVGLLWFFGWFWVGGFCLFVYTQHRRGNLGEIRPSDRRLAKATTTYRKEGGGSKKR